MPCPRCHAQVDEGGNFCPQCGYDLRKAQGEKKSSNADGGEGNSLPMQSKKPSTTGETASPARVPSPPPSPPSAVGAPDSAVSLEGQKPKGHIAGKYVAGIVVIALICIVALIFGIFTTLTNAEISRAASGSLQTSSTSSPSPTDAQVYLSDAQDCSSLNSTNTLNGTGANDYEFTVTGTYDWQAIMSCVANDLYMPIPIQAEIRNLIKEDVTSQLTVFKTSTVKWKVQDGSFIYATYSAPLNSNGGWAVKFSNIGPKNPTPPAALQ